MFDTNKDHQLGGGYEASEDEQEEQARFVLALDALSGRVNGLVPTDNGPVHGIHDSLERLKPMAKRHAVYLQISKGGGRTDEQMLGIIRTSQNPVIKDLKQKGYSDQEVLAALKAPSQLVGDINQYMEATQNRTLKSYGDLQALGVRAD